MEKVLLIDTSVGSFNRGDDIIMECVRKELAFITQNRFVLTLPSHVSSFHWYQIWKNSLAYQNYAKANLKFAGGSNLLVKNLFTHYPQWNINCFNCDYLKGTVLVGVGAGAGEKTNRYTEYVYHKILSTKYLHSVRDERTKRFLDDIGIKSINTGCATMWMFTPSFCETIPCGKSSEVVFSITPFEKKEEKYQELIDVLRANYDRLYFWPQGDADYDYLMQYRGVENLHILSPTKDCYDQFLSEHQIDYVGTRLHGGIYAMRHRRRAIVIAIDERARGINESNNLNCVEFDEIANIERVINLSLPTRVRMDFDAIRKWKAQFE